MKNRKIIIYSLILVLLIMISMVFYRYFIYTIDGFLETSHKKTIFLIWRNKINTETGFGIGDRIRGALCLYQYCKENNINLKMDITDDITGEYLKNIKSDDYLLVKDKPLILILWHWTYDNVKKTLDDELSKNDTIFVFCNNTPIKELDSDDKEFAKYISEPNDMLKNEIDKQQSLFPSKYGIKHFRFKDEVFDNDIIENNPIFIKCFELLKNDYKETDVLLSNSNNFKNYAKKQLKIHIIECDNTNCKIAHSGGNSKDVKNTLIEFYCIKNATYIKSYTCYDWESNFVKWPAKIYDIPFENVFIN